MEALVLLVGAYSLGFYIYANVVEIKEGKAR